MWRLEYNTASLLHGLCCAGGGITVCGRNGDEIGK